ncbi:MAG: hypothetical protein ABSG36_01515 [Acidimicrobiales bacterium]
MRSWWVVGGLCLGLLATSAAAAQAAPTAKARVAPSATPVGTQRSGVSSSSLCAALGQLDGLVVKRVDLFPANGIHFSFPATVTVTSPSLVQRAARAVCALPVMPHRRTSCPVDLGISYRLSFSSGAATFSKVLADATGCQIVTGIPQTRWAAVSPTFWRQLGKAMGLKNPTWDTFRGATS